MLSFSGPTQPKGQKVRGRKGQNGQKVREWVAVGQGCGVVPGRGSSLAGIDDA